jgi:fructose-1,6-bisphosphatase II
MEGAQPAGGLPAHTGDRDSAGFRSLGLDLLGLEATRAAALACQAWVGRGDAHRADEAATEAMRDVLRRAPGVGTVIVGEGAKDQAPMLGVGERLGSGRGPEFEIAVDPLECTKLCAAGLPGSLATIAFAPGGAMAPLGAAFYMDKLVGPPAVRDVLDISLAPEDNLQRAAAALGKRVGELRVVVLDKPRHQLLIARLHAAGVAVSSPSDGDVAGALQALIPDGEADLLMGIGGAPEGILAACAARALGAFMHARLAPQGAEEARRLAERGLTDQRTYALEDLVAADGVFVATGISGGLLLRRPWNAGGQLYTESLVIAAGSLRRVVTGSAAPAVPTPPAALPAGRAGYPVDPRQNGRA